VAHALLYAQYWAWRFSGVMASEMTSLGCHTDLWLPRDARYSGLVESQGWERIFSPLRHARDSLGSITEAMSRATGLDPSCSVICGIHDSNASYLEHLIDRPSDEPFAVISSGTWTVVMARDADLSQLRAERDMLANVDAYGAPIATARFMGGREYEVIAQSATPAEESALARVVQSEAYALPAFATAGPFNSAKGEIVNAGALAPQGRAALATAYSVLMCDLLLESLHARGPVIIDGPLAANPLFARLLASWRPDSQILVQPSAQGVCARAALFLSGHPAIQRTTPSPAEPLQTHGLRTYRTRWRKQLPDGI
jgi:sugar (pentulose or hexulose) kinase